MRRGIWVGVFAGAAAAVLAAEAPAKAQKTAENKAESVQLVTFPDTGWNPVKVVRGNSAAPVGNGQKPAAEKAEIAVEVVTFADPRDRPVSILRGSAQPVPDVGLFGPAAAGDLERVAFAVDGAESSHGADLGMWRPEPNGPQGPMQVSAAAAFDVGGGNRFDIAENRALGRAYLARMYRRYGNWPDAIAAYNWGPGNLDDWISNGRPAARLPLAIERYCDRVLHEAALALPGAERARQLDQLIRP